MNRQDREFVHEIARVEKEIHSLEEGDFLRVSTANGEYAGCVETVNSADPGKGNYVVSVDASVFNGRAMDADKHTIVLDYEGAFESECGFYAPYVVATAGQRGLGDVSDLYTEEGSSELVA